MIFIKFPNKESIKKITSTDNFQNTVSNVADEIIDKAEQYVSQTVDDFKNKISAIEAERRRKNLETMNQIRFNSIHLSDSQLRAFINDKSLDKFKRIGYAAAFADRYSDRRD